MRNRVGMVRGVWLVCALATLGIGCGTTRFVSGESALCGDTSAIAFHYATFQTPRDLDAETRPIWTGSRRVKLGEPVGVGGADVTDLRLVDLGSAGTTVNVGGSVVSDGRRVEGGPDSDEIPGAPVGWRVDVALTRDAARRLSQVADEVAGSYQVLALVIGDEVFSASVDLQVGLLGVVRIELPLQRGRDEGRAFLHEQLGCAAAAP